MADRADITPDLLRQLLRFDPNTGKIFWLPRPIEMFPSERTWKMWNTRFANKAALTRVSMHGYSVGTLLGMPFSAHRVIFAMCHGEWADADVDHINGVRTDNRIANLRAATRSENLRNSKIRNTNKSGIKGVQWCKRERKWLAHIRVNNKQICLGRFDDKTAAANSYATASALYHREFGRIK